jgi:hypothetical protein
LGLCSLTSLEAVLGRRMSSLSLFNLLVIILIPPSLTRNTPTLYGFQSMARAVTHSIDCQKDKKLLGADWGTRKSYHSSAGDKGEVMKAAKIGVSVIGSIILVAGVACSSNQQAPDISSDLRKALDQAGYTQVSASQRQCRERRRQKQSGINRQIRCRHGSCVRSDRRPPARRRKYREEGRFRS